MNVSVFIVQVGKGQTEGGGYSIVHGTVVDDTRISLFSLKIKMHKQSNG